MKKILIIIYFILFSSLAFGIEKADSVMVIKSESKLYLLKNGKMIREYHASFGANPIGHKQQEGDERTPEGKYFLDYKKEDSAFYKSIHISYPNDQDRRKAKEKGINPGGAIMIHGQRNDLGWLYFISRYFNWTDGCIAVSNMAMDEIWEAVSVGTPIEIKP
jgi:murein L,D-transpeptidase YafK